MSSELSRQLAAGRRSSESSPDAGMAFVGLWLVVSEARLLERVSRRRGDASDANADVVRRQSARSTTDVSWQRIEGDRPADSIAEEALAVVRLVPDAAAAPA